MATGKMSQGVLPTGSWLAKQREKRSVSVHRSARPSWRPLIKLLLTLSTSRLDRAAEVRLSDQTGVPSRD